MRANEIISDHQTTIIYFFANCYKKSKFNLKRKRREAKIY